MTPAISYRATIPHTLTRVLYLSGKIRLSLNIFCSIKTLFAADDRIVQRQLPLIEYFITRGLELPIIQLCTLDASRAAWQLVAKFDNYKTFFSPQ